ncbi:protein O-linked-mannose beta-1,2-N-acetylglucosaminyltransferase 1 isoform X2 [Penaeus vannamei]|uniref:protein O-linked-mannose beta-1,2-N-acetylglucosaminyltransferase 1 isoform X2 n=2 Tax=Penaeus vannamei TaxID=6689 RepID=UPI00387F71D3
MKRISFVLVFRHVGSLGIAVFVCFGLYGIYEFFFEDLPTHKVEFYQANTTAPFPFKDHGERVVSQYMQVGEILPNCGLDFVCPHNHFPVHIFSGKGKDDMPKICVSGKYVIQKDINNGGRGMNMVVVDSHRMKAVNARRFDTYAMDSSEMELFLMREVRDGDILIGLTFDEASRNLGAMAKNLLAELVKGRKIMPDPNVMQNDARAKFCKEHTYIAEFCSVDQRNTPLRPAILTNRQLVGSPMFSTPIMVIAGESLSSLTLTLETILSQPGIQPRYVVVIYNPELVKDVPELCKLFGFSYKAISEKHYFKILELTFETAHALFPGSLYVTVLEEGLLLSPDFLAYSATVLPLLHDPTILAISAWNANGFLNVSTRPDLVYRTEDFPGQAFTIRMATYFKEMKPNMIQCCSKRGWEGWLEFGRWEREIVVPDISRVLRRPVGPDLEPVTPLVHALFHRLRATNLEITAQINGADLLSAERYESHLVTKLNSSGTRMIRASKEDVVKCAETESIESLHLNLKNAKPEVFVLAYKEHDVADFNGMKILCRCFGLFFEDHSPPRGLHRGLLRFTMKGNEMILLSNRSPLFVIPPFNGTKLILP